MSSRTPRSRKATTKTTVPPADSELVTWLRGLQPLVIGADKALALAQVLEHELLAARTQLQVSRECLADVVEVSERARSLFPPPTQTPKA